MCYSLKNDLIKNDVKIFFNKPYLKKIDSNIVLAGNEIIEAGILFNAAGLNADKIARDFGCAQNYYIIPFKGIYLDYTNDDKPVKTNIYPVPNLKNPFLGIHYTITVDGKIKIGPTAIPAFWRENYKGLDNFKLNEYIKILFYEGKLFLSNSFGFRYLAFEEMKKYKKDILINISKKLEKKIEVKVLPIWVKLVKT